LKFEYGVHLGPYISQVNSPIELFAKVNRYPLAEISLE